MFRKPSWINNNTKKHGTFTTVSFCSCLCGDISFFSSVDGEKEYVNNCWYIEYTPFFWRMHGRLNKPSRFLCMFFFSRRFARRQTLGWPIEENLFSTLNFRWCINFQAEWWCRWWFQKFVHSTPTCKDDPIWLINIFQLGWNHQPVWSNYSDLTRPHSKWWFSKGNHLISGKSRFHICLNLRVSLSSPGHTCCPRSSRHGRYSGKVGEIL